MASLTAPGTLAPRSTLPACGVRIRAAVHWQTAALSLLTIAAAGVFAWLSVAQHHAYNTHAYDLSWFDQLAWNTARGHWLATSFSHGSYLKEHFSPALIVLGLIYKFWPAPESLLVLQAWASAAAAVPLYIGATRALESRTAGLFIAVAYLISPHLQGSILFDFHPDILAVFFVFLFFAILQHDHPRAALLGLAPAFLVKEDVALVGLGLSVIVWFAAYRRQARLLVCLSIVYVVFAEIVILLVPHLLHWGTTGEDGRYTYLLHGGLNDGRYLWQHLTGTLQLEALTYMFGSQAGLPLAGPGALVAVPDMLANVLAAHKPQLQLTLQYPLYPLALLLLASIVNIRLMAGSSRLQGVWRALRLPAEGRTTLLAAMVFVAEFVSYLIGSPLGLHVDPSRFRTSPHTAAIDAVVASVPPVSSVSAQSSILPHLSERENIREFPYLDGAEYVIIDRKGFVAWDSDVAGYSRTVAALPERGYCRIRAEDGVEIWTVDNLCEAQ